jgi:DNA invertase Pin-like site-specific DNA recombinase
LIHYYTSMKRIHVLAAEIIDVLMSIEGGSARKQAAKMLGISERTLQNNMNNYKITLRDWKPKKEEVPKRSGWGANKLSKQKAHAIRKLFEDGAEIKDIAKQYDVTFSTISRIINNITYKELKIKFGGEAIVNVEYKP